MRNRWNSDLEQSGGGVLIDNGTHSVDIVRFLLGQITEVLAIPGPRIQPILVEDNVTLMARTQDGRQASIETSWSVHKDLSAFISIYGTEGTIEVGWKGSRIRKGRSGALGDSSARAMTRWPRSGGRSTTSRLPSTATR